MGFVPAYITAGGFFMVIVAAETLIGQDQIKYFYDKTGGFK